MQDYLNLIVVGPNDGDEWQQQAVAVPRVGDNVTVRKSGAGNKVFEGEVEEVHWGLIEGRAGIVATVWLK